MTCNVRKWAVSTLISKVTQPQVVVVVVVVDAVDIVVDVVVVLVSVDLSQMPSTRSDSESAEQEMSCQAP